MDDLQRGSLQQMERLSNVTRLVESVLNGDQLRFWSSYEHNLAELEEKLMNYNAGNLQDTASIRTAFESLKEECLQLKSCCQSRCAESFEKGNAIAEEKFTGPISSSLSHSLTTEDVLQILETVVSSSDAEEANNAKKPIGDRILSYLTDIRVRKIVKDMLKVYDADKTGRVDYALESAGGLVISTRCTQRYDLKQMAIKILSFTLYYENNNPRTVIQGNPVQPGTCWAFQGFPGYLLIKLRSFVHVSGFTLEHAPKSILPNEEMRSAPRTFNVWGFTDEIDPEPVLFGNYEFKDSDESLQYFPVQNTAITKAYEYVELRVHSNHGQLEYTCLYRFRVHGKPA